MQSSLLESLFAGDPFFERSTVLWPLCRGPLGGVREDFLPRRRALADGLLKELSGVFPYDFLKAGRRGDGAEARRPSTEGDLRLSLDVREFCPEDISVKLAGRQLAVVAAKPAEEGQARRRGFVQKIGLPDHVDTAAIACSLTPEGLLRIEAPAATRRAGGAEERTVPIRFRTSLNFPVNGAKQEEREQEAPPKNA